MCEKKQMEWQEREGTRLRLREGWGGAGGKERVTERMPVVACGREQAQSRRQVCTFNATFSACRGQDKAEKGEGQVRRCARESAHTWRCIRAGGETATSARCGTRESAAFTNFERHECVCVRERGEREARGRERVCAWNLLDPHFHPAAGVAPCDTYFLQHTTPRWGRNVRVISSPNNS